MGHLSVKDKTYEHAATYAEAGMVSNEAWYVSSGARGPRGAGPGVQCALRLLLLGVTVAGLGCAGARVEVAHPAPSEVPQPDFILVERFAVSPWDVKLDRGLSAQALRGLKERALNEEEQKVGAAVATVMEEETVRLLRQARIPAYVDSYAPTATRTTALLQGQFLSVDEGDRTQRVWIGFGLGGAKLQIKMQVLQGGVVVAEGEV
jgi:hypothetical protein